MNTADPAAVRQAANELAARCEVMAKALAANGPPAWRHGDPGYAGLARIIAFQQISVKAAATIWGRVEQRVGAIAPAAMLATPIDDLRACGLSRPKIAHLRSIAEAVVDGRLDFTRVAAAPDEDARAELVAVKGIGPWTADIFLLFSLGRPDLFPQADLGLMEAYRMLTDAPERMAPKAFQQRAELWRPHRGVAAHMLWAYINASRNAQAGGA